MTSTTDLHLTDPQAFLLDLYRAAVKDAQPLYSMAQCLPKPPKGRTLVLGAGKAGGSMAQALEALWPADAPLSGLVVTRYHHIPPRPEGLAQRIEVVEAAHPVPDAAGLAAAERILALTEGLTEDDLVLCLISGGGSALLTLPAEGIDLEEKQRINRALLESGAAISEMNCVRKHLSRIKGGRLGAACAPARVVTLTISEGQGTTPPSSPAAPPCPMPAVAPTRWPSSRATASTCPNPRRALEAGELETPSPATRASDGHEVHMIATPQHSLEAAARGRGGGPAHPRAVRRDRGRIARSRQGPRRPGARRGPPRPAVCKALRDPVRRRDHGHHPQRPAGTRGAAAARASSAWGWPGPAGAGEGLALAADTDGIDGVEDNAGARVSPDTLARAQAQGMRIAEYLDRNDGVWVL
ncbi:Glycerate kinase [Manis javanica]|nr:Glycerate kinase [Manis javanica]